MCQFSLKYYRARFNVQHVSYHRIDLSFQLVVITLFTYTSCRADLGHFFTSIARDEHPLSIQILKFLAVNGVAFPVVPRAKSPPSVSCIGFHV